MGTMDGHIKNFKYAILNLDIDNIKLINMNTSKGMDANQTKNEPKKLNYGF